jgi:hypothetical protein
VKRDDIYLAAGQDGGLFRYVRECAEESREKTLIPRDGNILLDPVGPVNRPSEVTRCLLIEFDQTPAVEPSAREIEYLRLAIEIDAGTFPHNGLSPAWFLMT